MRILGGARVRPGAGLRLTAAGARGVATGDWPLSISSNGRYLQRPNGTPFFIHGDTPWMATNQLSLAQMDTYLDDRESKGFNAVLFESPGMLFTSQTPNYRDVDGNDPFNTTSFTACTWTSPVEAYWSRVDSWVNKCKDRGIVCFFEPAYLGFGGGSGASGDQGWDYQVLAASNANLQSYGEFLANRYTQGNVIWVMGGDYAASASVTKQWNIALGIKNVTPNALFSGHTARNAPTGTEAYPSWSGESGFEASKWVNATYGGQSSPEWSLAATAYARSGPMPFYFIEGDYDGDGASAFSLRSQAYESILSGGCGHFFGNTPIWGFGEPTANGGSGPASALSTSLNTTVTQQMAHVRKLFAVDYDFSKLVPKTDTSLVSSSLGSGEARVCPALSSDGNFALIWVPNSQTVTLVKSALTPSTIRVRLYDTTAGTYSTHTASTSNTGTLSVATGGECVIVVDAA